MKAQGVEKKMEQAQGVTSGPGQFVYLKLYACTTILIYIVKTNIKIIKKNKQF